MKQHTLRFPLACLAALLCMISLSSPLSWAEVAPAAKTTQSTKAAPTTNQAAQAVNINTASAEEIAETLKGIGLKKAQAIVAFREANGQFASKEALTAVKGIGESTVAKNSQLISLK